MLLKVFILSFFLAIIQSKTLDEGKHSNNEIETLPLIVTYPSQKENEKLQLDALISDLEVQQQEIIKMASTEIVSLEKLENSNLKIDKELIKKLIDNTGKLLAALAKVGGAILAIVKDLSPI